jgi:uncharacterized secreted protein with C-terminal beta-propeller domain
MKKRTLLGPVLGLTILPLVASADSERPTAKPDGCQTLLTRLVSDEIARSNIAARNDSGWPGKLFDATKRPEPRTAAEAKPPASAPAPPPAAGADMDEGAGAPARFAEQAKDTASAASSREKGRGAGGPKSYSRTNTQEQAVDEGDIVKTDGRTIYHVSCSRDREASGCRNEIRIYSSWPAHEAKLLARYAIPPRDGSPEVKQIYLHDRRLIVAMGATSSHGARTREEIAHLSPRGELNIDGQVSRVLILDVAAPARPELVRELYVEGAFIESRMIGSRLYLATSSPGVRLPSLLIGEIRATVARFAEGRAEPTTEAVIAALEPRWGAWMRSPGLPHARELFASGAERASAPVYACADLHAGEAVPGANLLNVVEIDTAAASSAVLGAGISGHTAQSVVYASEGAFYVAGPTAPPQGKPWSSATHVRKLELGSGGKPRFAGIGTVRGTLLNQFAMSEHAGHLRVATSDNWLGNNLFVLRAADGRLDVAGALENLAQNERIYAVRMMGERGYVVTFRRTDPLYTLDLSNPTDPKVVGELHIEGFSNYLHPLGRDHLLAVGQDADQFGRATGFHLQIFDVSDPKQPKRKFHEKLDASSISESQTDHHAFMFEPETNTFAVPWKSAEYWGLIAYRVDPRDGFVNLGRVNHALMYKQFFQKQCKQAPISECKRTNHWWTFVTRPAIAVDRVIAIDGQLYSMSPSGVMVHRAGSERLTQTASVLIAAPSWPRPEVASFERW